MVVFFSFRQDVIKALNEAVDKYEEGLVIKSPLSIYQPNVRNGRYGVVW
jgi:ATP-dependent DNA ligase